MSLTHFTVRHDGFCGLFSSIAEHRNAAVIMLEDDPPDSYLVKTALKWLNRSGVSAMGIGPEKYMKGVHSWPLENIENAVRFLKTQGYDRVGVIGSSFGSNMALSAAARIPEITLTIALTPNDWYTGEYFMISWTDHRKDLPTVNRHLPGEESLCRICPPHISTLITGTCSGKRENSAEI